MRRSRTVLALVLLPMSLVAAACTPSSPSSVRTVESVDVARYLGTWYEIASVKQFFSVGLVNSRAEYSLRPDGSILVRNSGRYGANGPESVVIGSAYPVDSTNARLNVSFSGTNTRTPPGNYWVVALDEDYRWAVVSDPTGQSLFVLSRDRRPDPGLLPDLLARARAAGVNTANVTPTPQV